MEEIVRNIIGVLEAYFIYVYPGFVTIMIFHFSRAKGTKMNKSTLGICVVISYVYILVYKFFCKREVSQFFYGDYVVMLIISIVLPIIWNNVSRLKFTENLLKKIGLNTTIEDNVWDYIKYRDKEKKGISVKVFLDNKDLMYEGSLRYHESDMEKEPTICLSGYRRYIKENGRYSKKQDYNNDNSRWVLINIREITRSEIKFSSEK